VPETLLLIGGAIIVAAGIFIFLREQATAPPDRPPVPPEPHA
jgi:hypothetical protein